MSEHGPYFFFFSYARDDGDAYLEKFYKELTEAVSRLGDQKPEYVAFRDSKNIITGADWNTKITGALQTSNVLVCIYTARFFGREFCAKEFAAFLKRNSEMRYEPVRDADGATTYRIREARNILPILWVGEDDLAIHPDPKKKLPPHVVRTIHYTIKESSLPTRVVKEYQENGLRRMYIKRPSATRDDIIKYFAKAIVTAEPLPNNQPLSFEKLWNAFWDIPPECVAEPATQQSEVLKPPVAASAVSPGQGDLLAVEITTTSDGMTGWTPYSGGPTLAAAVEEIVYDYRGGFSHLVFDPNTENFEDQVWSAVKGATDRHAIPILFINPECFKKDQHRSALVRLLQRGWRGGVIIPADSSDINAVGLVKDMLRELKQPDVNGARIVVRESVGIDALRTSVMSVAMEIFTKIAEVGEVQQKPSQKEGPDVRPRITNFLDTPS
jgi:hypothetical protein